MGGKPRESSRNMLMCHLKVYLFKFEFDGGWIHCRDDLCNFIAYFKGLFFSFAR